MNEQDLFAALGEIDDCLLLSPEQPRKLSLRRFGLIAAILCALVITACAAPVILGAIQSGDPEYLKEQEYEIRHFDSREETQYTLTYQEDVYTVELKITTADEIPETIETAYLPAAVPESWEGEETVINSGGGTLTCKWDIRSDAGSAIAIYQQWPLNADDADGTKTIYVYADPGAEVEAQMHAVGQISVLEIACTANPQAVQNEDMEHPVVFTTGGKRDFYWSDGKYLFRLYVPYELDISAVEGIVSGLTAVDVGSIPVEDIDKQF